MHVWIPLKTSVSEEVDEGSPYTQGLVEKTFKGSASLDGEDDRTGIPERIENSRSKDDHNGIVCKQSAMLLQHKLYVLYTHNRLRSKLALGKQQNKEGMMGSGKNIYTVRWDCDLEFMAHKWTKSCTPLFMPSVTSLSGAQLVKGFDTIFHGRNIAQHIDHAMRSWWTEYKRHGNVDHKNRYFSRQLYYGWANEYDCNLEWYAQIWADNCIFEHSNRKERPNQGQNLYMTSFTNVEQNSMLHTAIELWWKELEEYGIPADGMLTKDVWTRKGNRIGHFTQVVTTLRYYCLRIP
ncbi:unnamed protein product [Angiostrongylus costaricensis]|uniref:SCP domain-containing protein n=1 Tax=Angiostrongylus costaricensis TaxID=334426 RepID=A0A0R3PZP9_ANGCS|nr:unnamed protein product [Angiostrongylus costaricensis]